MEGREKLLKEKAEEISRKLEGWVKENLSLKQNEFIALILTIEKRPIIEVKQARVNTPRARRTNQLLTEQDWEKIFSLPFSKKQKDIINLFRENGNEPLLPIQIGKFISENINNYPANAADDFSYGQWNAINSIFSRGHSPYRLLREKGGVYWNQHRFRMFIVEY